LLRFERVGKRFGAVEAVAALDLDVPAGARLGLIGPNGSGKTTALNLVAGLIAPDAGRIVLDGRDIADWPAHRRAQAGISRTFQNLRLAERMTVLENAVAGEPARAAEARAMLERVGLGPEAQREARDIPLPARRRLELARALLRQPRLLLLDEPAGGMIPAETAAMGELIRALVPAETALILVEHKLGLVRALCDRVAVLHFGRKIAEGAAEAVLCDPAVAAVYLGRQGAGDA
jgi:ABC-type branched-subunit amino acid transport system ATPase component